MKNHSLYLTGCKSLGIIETLPNETVKALDQFTQRIYNVPDSKDVNQGRYALLNNILKHKKNKNPLDQLKSVNSSRLPPCKSELIMKANRANYIAWSYRNAHVSYCHPWNALQNGWVINNFKYEIKWYDGEQFPPEILFEEDKCSEDECSEDESSEDESSEDENSDDESSEDESSEDENSKDESSEEGYLEDESSDDESSMDES